MAKPIAEILGEYYLLNNAVKPEHLLSAKFNEVEVAERLERFAVLLAKTDSLAGIIPEKFRDAFFELVAYPVRGAALANEKILCAEQSRRSAAKNDPTANPFAERAEKAHVRIQAETQFYNTELAGGKWRNMMSEAPGKMRVARAPDVARVTNGVPASVFEKSPAEVSPKKSGAFAEVNRFISMEASHFSRNLERSGASWRVVEGLGRTGHALTIFPATTPSITNLTNLTASAPVLEYDFTCDAKGAMTATVYCVPVHRLYPGRGARLGVGVDDATPQIVDIESEEYSKTWATNVFRAAALGVATNQIAAAGKHTLKLWMVDPGVPVDKIVLNFGGEDYSYFGPPETRVKGDAF